MPDTPPHTEATFGLGNLAKFGNMGAMAVIVAFLFLLRGDLKEAGNIAREDMREERIRATESMDKLGGKVDALTNEIRKFNGGQ